MIDEKSKTSRFIGLFFLGNFLFCYPVLTLFNLNIMILGIPVFFLFFFLAWLGLISLIPNLIPAAIGFGFWKLYSGELNIGLMMVLTIIEILTMITMAFQQKMKLILTEAEVVYRTAITTIYQII